MSPNIYILGRSPMGTFSPQSTDLVDPKLKATFVKYRACKQNLDLCSPLNVFSPN